MYLTKNFCRCIFFVVSFYFFYFFLFIWLHKWKSNLGDSLHPCTFKIDYIIFTDVTRFSATLLLAADSRLLRVGKQFQLRPTAGARQGAWDREAQLWQIKRGQSVTMSNRDETDALTKLKYLRFIWIVWICHLYLTICQCRSNILFIHILIVDNK